jgi:hypothetical protein
MSYTDIHESGTCRALPLRDSWGRPHTDGWWADRQAHEAPTRPVRAALDTFTTTRSEG